MNVVNLYAPAQFGRRKDGMTDILTTVTDFVFIAPTARVPSIADMLFVRMLFGGCITASHTHLIPSYTTLTTIA